MWHDKNELEMRAEDAMKESDGLGSSGIEGLGKVRDVLAGGACSFVLSDCEDSSKTSVPTWILLDSR